MKRITIALVLLSAFAWAAGGPNPAQYNINVHVSSSCMDRQGNQLLQVVIDGKKYELKTVIAVGRVLSVGDYKAKLIVNRTSAYESYQIYEFLLPDKTRQYELVGQAE